MASIRGHTARGWGLDSPRGTWQDLAACQGEDPTWWDLSDNPDGRARNWAALRICSTCPVRQQCADQAVALRLRGVIAGGMRLGQPGRGYVTNQPPRPCRRCGTRFTPVASGHAYCTPGCRRAARETRRAVRV